jgi:hypothetical protein
LEKAGFTGDLGTGNIAGTLEDAIEMTRENAKNKLVEGETSHC